MSENGINNTPIFVELSQTQANLQLAAAFGKKMKENEIKTESVMDETAGTSNSSSIPMDLNTTVPCNQKLRCPEFVDDIACLYTTTTEDRLIRHIRKVHRGEHPFQCTMCDYSTYNKALFEEHVRIHQGIKPFKCRFCTYRSVSKKNTKKHELIHRPDNPLKCPECDFIGRHERSLRLHVKTHMPNIPCSKCDYKAKDLKAMKAHRRMHVCRKWHKCDLCNTRFVELKNLAIHKKKQKKCTECNARLCNKVMFSKHMSSVHGKIDGAVFTCAICKWSCTSRPRALLHIIHHPVQQLDESLDLQVLRQFGIIR